MIKKFLIALITLSIIIISIVELILWIIKSESLIFPYILNLIIFIFSIILFILINNKSLNNFKNKKIWINKDNNKISITENAIIQLIKNILIKNKSISNVQVLISSDKLNNIFIEIKTIIELGSNIIEMTEFIRSKIKKIYKDTIGNNLSDIKIIIIGFSDNNK